MLSGFIHAGQKNGADKNSNKGWCPCSNQRRKAQGRAKDLHKVCEQKNGYGDDVPRVNSMTRLPRVMLVRVAFAPSMAIPISRKGRDSNL